MADHFCLDRAVGHGCHSEIRNVNRIRKRVDLLFWYHCNGCFICIRAHKIRVWVFKHQFQMAGGHSLCVWMFGIGILHTWLQKPSFGGRFCHCIAFTGGIRNFGVFPFYERVSILAWPAMLIGSIGVAIMFLDVVPELRIGYV